MVYFIYRIEEILNLNFQLILSHNHPAATSGTVQWHGTTLAFVSLSLSLQQRKDSQLVPIVIVCSYLYSLHKKYSINNDFYTDFVIFLVRCGGACCR